MRNLCLNLLMMLALGCAVGNAQYKTIDLKPIQKHGWNYYYDFRKLSTAEALQVPFIALDDMQVNKYYNAYTGLQLVSSVVSLAPLLYILYGAGGNYYSPGKFWTITIGSFATSIVLQIWSHNRMKLAVERYNMLLLPHPTGRMPSATGGLSLGLRL